MPPTTDDRRAALLAAAREVLAEKGYTGASMLEIARRARASKETLYSHFGDKRGLFEALILDNAAEVNAALGAALEAAADMPPARALPRFCLALQRLLLGEAALVVNRAAIAEAAADPALGRLLVARGRDSTLPRLVRYLDGQRAAGRLRCDDATEAAEVLVALCMGDTQVRRLLGVLPQPDDATMARRAESATRRFLALYGAEGFATFPA
ncbi:TetR/AcrR family transcriptional regulator [Novispirillum sp. DQ9]|uniref:TetR/AcrR family transcriptional regulator n=1 Tax=Novispirillum sp. DQ9 TaxID=3398612 RepID=UPI003C7E6724